MEVTNFYFPRCGRNLTMVKEDASISSSEEDSKQDGGEDGENNFDSGFIGTKPGDAPYGGVMKLVKNNVFFENAYPAPISGCRNKLEWAVIKNRSPMFYPRRVNISDHIKADIVTSWVYLNKSKDEEAVRRNLTRQQIDNILYEFQEIRRITNEAQKRESRRKSKVIDKHIERLQEFVKQHDGRVFTLAQARHFLINKYSDLDGLSLSTVSRLMSKKLKFSYKSSEIKTQQKHTLKIYPISNLDESR